MKDAKALAFARFETASIIEDASKQGDSFLSPQAASVAEDMRQFTDIKRINEIYIAGLQAKLRASLESTLFATTRAKGLEMIHANMIVITQLTNESERESPLATPSGPNGMLTHESHLKMALDQVILDGQQALADTLTTCMVQQDRKKHQVIRAQAKAMANVEMATLDSKSIRDLIQQEVSSQFHRANPKHGHKHAFVPPNPQRSRGRPPKGPRHGAASQPGSAPPVQTRPQPGAQRRNGSAVSRQTWQKHGRNPPTTLHVQQSAARPRPAQRPAHMRDHAVQASYVHAAAYPRVQEFTQAAAKALRRSHSAADIASPSGNGQRAAKRSNAHQYVHVPELSTPLNHRLPAGRTGHQGGTF